MSTPKSTKSYPREFLEICESINANCEKALEIPMDTMAEARTFRMTFHSFRAAAIKEELDKTFPEIHAMYVRVLDNPPRVVIEHKDYTKTAIAVRKAIEKRNEENGN